MKTTLLDFFETNNIFCSLIVNCYFKEKQQVVNGLKNQELNENNITNDYYLS